MSTAPGKRTEPATGAAHAVNLHDTPAWGLKRVFSPGAQYCPDLEAGAALGLVWHPQIANSETETFRLAYAQTCVRGQSSGPWNRRPARLSPGESRPIDRALTTIPAAGFRRARKSPWPMASRDETPQTSWKQASRSAGSERSVSSRAAQIDGAVETAARRPVRNRGRRPARPPALAERQSVASRSLA
jgi:hypothetical protein